MIYKKIENFTIEKIAKRNKKQKHEKHVKNKHFMKKIKKKSTLKMVK